MAVNQGLTWLLEMLFPGDPFKLQVHNDTLHHILRRGGRMTTKNTVISCSVMKYAGWCSCELVLYDQTSCLTMTVEGQMLLYFKGKKWQLWLYYWYHLNIHTDEQLYFFYFYKYDLDSEKPSQRTLSWKVFSFCVRLAKVSGFLGVRAKQINIVKFANFFFLSFLSELFLQNMSKNTVVMIWSLGLF